MTTAETTTQPMTAEEMIALTKRHTIFSWSAQGSVSPIAMVRGEGIYFWDASGKRYIDMNSQLMCVNIGHGDKRVIEAIKRQAEEMERFAAEVIARRNTLPRSVQHHISERVLIT